MLVINEISESLSESKKPLIKQIYDKAGKTLFVIGLRKGIELTDPATTSKAKIMVVQGEIDFNTTTSSYRLERFDSFDIPSNLKYSVVGVFDAIFLLLLRKSNETS